MRRQAPTASLCHLKCISTRGRIPPFYPPPRPTAVVVHGACGVAARQVYNVWGRAGAAPKDTVRSFRETWSGGQMRARSSGHAATRRRSRLPHHVLTQPTPPPLRFHPSLRPIGLGGRACSCAWVRFRDP
jgi:hypothetical protein